jgi:hypothetical protein
MGRVEKVKNKRPVLSQDGLFFSRRRKIAMGSHYV